MGTVRGGTIKCSKCGSECTSLYGFAMSVDRVAHTHNEAIKDIVKRIDDKYGAHDFIICWDCTIEMMGIKPLDAKREVPREVNSEPSDVERSETGYPGKKGKK